MTIVPNDSGKPLISLIVSVYNTALYLRQCLDSVIHQTYTNWELVVMDDGSTDGSPAICDEYAAKDQRIRVVHKPNTGKPDCCNIALGLVNGQYVGFIDSDDWVEPVYLETLLTAAESVGVDFVSCGYLNEFLNHTDYDPVCSVQQSLTSSQTVKRLYQRSLYGYFPGRLFSRKIIQEPIPQLRRYEDFAVIYKWISHGDGAVLCPQCLYHYRQRASSIMNSEGDRMMGMIPLFEEFYEYVKDNRLLSMEENKGIALRNFIRFAKDIARSIPTQTGVRYLFRIRQAVLQIQPVPPKYVDKKTMHRMQMLLRSVHRFVFFMRVGSFFFVRRKTKKLKYQKFI